MLLRNVCPEALEFFFFDRALRKPVSQDKLAEVIFVNPYCRISDLVEAGIAKRQSASVYLKSLVDDGLLEEIKAGRENLYINPALLALLVDQPARRLDN